MKTQPGKILAMQFKFFGDAVLLTPALRAIREHFPGCELHALMPEEIAPLYHHLPWINRVWAMPRRRGTASLTLTWPVIRALRQEHFDRSVDFGGNDRGAIASLLIHARHRLGPVTGGGFWGRRFCYNQRVPLAPVTEHETRRLAHVLSPWHIAVSSVVAEIHADPALDAAANEILPAGTIIFHIATSQPKKEWPLRHWAKLYQTAIHAGYLVIFNTGGGSRERALLNELQRLLPGAPALSPDLDRAMFLAVLKRAKIFISGDTGPLHFAAALGVPTISLFGPTRTENWAPLGEQHRALTGSQCSCEWHSAVCRRPSHCLAAISPEDVFAALNSITTKSLC